MAPMRAAAIAVALSAISTCAVACTDPAVRVQFDVPADYRDQVESVELELLLPPPGAPFDCDDVAFREVSDDDLAAATVEQVLTREDNAELSAIPRLGDKLFLARGLDGAGDAVVAACGQVGDIDSDTDLSLTGEPTAGVVLPLTEPGSPLVDFTAGVFDIASRPLAGVATRWTVTGPADETSTGMATTDGMGRVMITPQAPALPGPIAVDVRPRWVRTTPPSLLAFRQPDPMLSTPLPGDATDSIVEADLVVGRLGPNGEMGFAALGPGANPVTGGRQVLVGYYDPTRTPPLHTATTSAILGAFALGVVFNRIPRPAVHHQRRAVDHHRAQRHADADRQPLPGSRGHAHRPRRRLRWRLRKGDGGVERRHRQHLRRRWCGGREPIRRSADVG